MHYAVPGIAMPEFNTILFLKTGIADLFLLKQMSWIVGNWKEFGNGQGFAILDLEAEKARFIPFHLHAGAQFCASGRTLYASHLDLKQVISPLRDSPFLRERFPTRPYVGPLLR